MKDWKKEHAIEMFIDIMFYDDEDITYEEWHDFNKKHNLNEDEVRDLGFKEIHKKIREKLEKEGR